MLNGKLRVSRALAIKVLSSLDYVDSKSKSRLFILLEGPIANSHIWLDNHKLELVGDWRFLAVLHLIEAAPGLSAKEIADRLMCDEDTVREVVASLVRLDLIRLNEGGQYEVVNSNLFAGPGDKIELIRQHHKANLDLTMLALEKIPAARRDFTTYTFPCDQDGFDTIKRGIRDLYARTSALSLAAKGPKEVYRLSASMFPLNFKDTKD